jgi:hypothetical protein
LQPLHGDDFKYWSFIRYSRALGHLVVDLGDEARKSAQGDYTFFASENLYGLTVIARHLNKRTSA